MFLRCLLVRFPLFISPDMLFVTSEDITVGNIAAYSRDDVLYLVNHLVFNIWYNKETGVMILDKR